MSFKCRIFGHQYRAGNPEERGLSTRYNVACTRLGCGAPAILTVYGGNPASEIILYAPQKRWAGKGPIPAWAKIVVS